MLKDCHNAKKLERPFRLSQCHKQRAWILEPWQSSSAIRIRPLSFVIFRNALGLSSPTESIPSTRYVLSLMPITIVHLQHLQQPPSHNARSDCLICADFRSKYLFYDATSIYAIVIKELNSESFCISFVFMQSSSLSLHVFDITGK